MRYKTEHKAIKKAEIPIQTVDEEEGVFSIRTKRISVDFYADTGEWFDMKKNEVHYGGVLAFISWFEKQTKGEDGASP